MEQKAGTIRCDASVVIPVYGCGWALEELCGRLKSVLENEAATFEILLIDDRSSDSSWGVIEGLSKDDPRIKGVLLSRNFGQQAALTAGLMESTGDIVIVMDCDLQDPPEFIPQLLKPIREGANLVLARRKAAFDSTFRRLANRVYFPLLSAISGIRIDGDFGAFSALTRKVVNAFCQFQDRDRHYLFILRWLGFDPAIVEYERRVRPHGESSHSIRMLIGLAIDGIFFQTTAFLRWVLYAGIAVGAIGFLLGLFMSILYFRGSPPPGWTSIIVVSLVLGSMVIVSVGITGLYIARIFEQVKGRPLFQVDKRTF